MALRLALFALLMAFGASVTFATVTTLRQVHLAHTSPAAAQLSAQGSHFADPPDAPEPLPLRRVSVSREMKAEGQQ